MEYKCTKDQKTGDEDAKFQGPWLSQAAKPENEKVRHQTANDGKHKIIVEGIPELPGHAECVRRYC